MQPDPHPMPDGTILPRLRITRPPRRRRKHSPAGDCPEGFSAVGLPETNLRRGALAAPGWSLPGPRPGLQPTCDCG